MSTILDTARALARLAIKGVVVESAGSTDADKLVKTNASGLISTTVLGNQTTLTAHIADETKHLTSAQNTWLDALTASSTELNYVTGVTSAIQTQLDAKATTSALTTHTSDATVHLTGPQNTLLDALTASATELNYVVGVTSAVQTQLDAKATSSALTTHISDETKHLTSAQNTWLDALTASSTELNYVTGVTSAIQTQLDTKAAANALNASNLTSGTIPDARFPATLPAASGVNLTALNATQLTSGTVPDARFPATLPAASGVNLTALNATELTSGVIPDSRFPSPLPNVSGVNLVSLNASNLGSGTVPDARFPATLPALSGANLVALTPANITGAGTASQYLSGTGWTYGIQTPVSTCTNASPPVFTLANANTIFNSTESATPYDITIPLNSSVAYPNGTTLTFVQSGSSVITIEGAGGVTLVSHGSLYDSDGVGSLITALKLDTNTWLVSGNLA